MQSKFGRPPRLQKKPPVCHKSILNPRQIPFRPDTFQVALTASGKAGNGSNLLDLQQIKLTINPINQNLWHGGRSEATGSWDVNVSYFPDEKVLQYHVAFNSLFTFGSWQAQTDAQNIEPGEDFNLGFRTMRLFNATGTASGVVLL